MARSPSHSAAVAVITVSYGSEDVLPGFLASIPAASMRPVISIVVDNKPESGGAAKIAAAAGADYLPAPGNRGYGAAVNAARRRLPASVDWILISNPDVLLRPSAIDALVSTAESDPVIGAVGPAIFTETGEVYPSARALPSLRTGVGHALFANLWTDNPWTRAYQSEEYTDRVRKAGWLSGACLLVRREAFDEIDGFDDGYFMYFEDVDLGFRLARAGYRNLYQPAATAVHIGAHSTSSDSARMIRAHHASARRFLNKKYHGWYLFPVRLGLTIGLSVRSTVLVRRAER